MGEKMVGLVIVGSIICFVIVGFIVLGLVTITKMWDIAKRWREHYEEGGGK